MQRILTQNCTHESVLCSAPGATLRARSYARSEWSEFDRFVILFICPFMRRVLRGVSAVSFYNLRASPENAFTLRPNRCCGGGGGGDCCAATLAPSLLACCPHKDKYSHKIDQKQPRNTALSRLTTAHTSHVPQIFATKGIESRGRKWSDNKSRWIYWLVIEVPLYWSFSVHFQIPLSLFSSLLSAWVLVSNLSSIFSTEAICVSPIYMGQAAGDTLPSSQSARFNKQCWSHSELKYGPFTSLYAFCSERHFESDALCCCCQTRHEGTVAAKQDGTNSAKYCVIF